MRETIYEMNMRHAREHEALDDKHYRENMEAGWRESQEAMAEWERREEEVEPVGWDDMTRTQKIVFCSFVAVFIVLIWVFA